MSRSKPNIEGHFGPRESAGFAIGSKTSGVFSVGEQFVNRIVAGDVQNPTAGHYINFSASDVSSVFSGDKVQEPALQVLCCIKF